MDTMIADLLLRVARIVIRTTIPQVTAPMRRKPIQSGSRWIVGMRMNQDAWKHEPHLDPKPPVAIPGIVDQDEPGIRCVEADQDQEDSSKRSVDEGSSHDQDHPTERRLWGAKPIPEA